MARCLPVALAFSQWGCCSVTSAAPGSLVPNATAIVTMRFSPCGAGVRGATMNIANNDSNENLFDFPLVGTGINPDQDGDGSPDGTDAFPRDANESADTDHDGIGNNADTDDDKCKIPNAKSLR